MYVLNFLSATSSSQLRNIIFNKMSLKSFRFVVVTSRKDEDIMPRMKNFFESFKTIFRHFYPSFKTNDKEINIKNTLMFDKLCGVVEKSEDKINKEVTDHLKSFGKKLSNTSASEIGFFQRFFILK